MKKSKKIKLRNVINVFPATHFHQLAVPSRRALTILIVFFPQLYWINFYINEEEVKELN